MKRDELIERARRVCEEWYSDAEAGKGKLIDLIARAMSDYADERLEAAADVVDRAEREKWGSFHSGTRMLIPFLPDLSRTIRALKEEKP